MLEFIPEYEPTGYAVDWIKYTTKSGRSQKNSGKIH
jgi:hypothetical protein